MFGYLYNADGVRIAKGTIQLVNGRLSCDTTQNNFQITTSYILDQNNQQLTEMSWRSGAPQWARTNVWAAGELMATYSVDPNTSDNQPGILYFHLTDWLGTRRVLTDYAGNEEEVCHSLPYGNGEDCAPTHSEHLFTGKERDTESGNDYFGARYYASSMGRFMSPDPSGLTYADITNPQSFNLYSYAWNNPLRNIDPTGMYCFYGGQGDTPENDSDPTDYDFTDTPEDCGGQWIDNPSTTVTVSAGGDNGNALSTFPSDISQNIQFIPGAGCSAALQVARKTPQGVARADANSSVLSAAASANNISPKLLAAVGVRETNFTNEQEVLDGGSPGPGMGVYQLTNQKGVTAAQAFNLPFAANKAANILSANMTTLANKFPNFTDPQLLQATAASYNLGPGGISGNPATIDVGSAPAPKAPGNYGSNVVNLMNCF